MPKLDTTGTAQVINNNDGTNGEGSGGDCSTTISPTHNNRSINGTASTIGG